MIYAIIDDMNNHCDNPFPIILAMEHDLWGVITKSILSSYSVIANFAISSIYLLASDSALSVMLSKNDLS